MKLHWSPRSPYVRKVMIVAMESGTIAQIEKIRSVVAMATLHADLMKDNPLSKIPTLVTDDGKVLYDSIVICEYLDHIGKGPKLFPQDFDARIDALRWHALGNGLTDLLLLWNNDRNRPVEIHSKPHLSAFEGKYIATLDHLEATIDQLARRPFDIGHVGVGMALGYADFRFAATNWREGRPKLAAWFETIAQRPSFKETNAVLDGS